jgi:ATP-dependent DNA helicase 2 subunit 2
MLEKECMAIARWVSREGMDPKMGVLVPGEFEKVDCLLWSPVLKCSCQFLPKLN